MYVIGLDIGGANVKVADTDHRCATVPFEIWREPKRLTDVLRSAIEPFSRPDLFAVTTTAELADCFVTKAEGVGHVLSAVEAVAEDVPLAVWQTGAEFVSPEVAREIPLLVAAANWHALATWVGRLVPTCDALLIDVGSTTTDFVPLRNGVPVHRGFTDLERLLAGELVYTGVGRTPVFHVAPRVPLRGGRCPLAPELFATMRDVWLLTGHEPEDASDTGTANGRPATREEARTRLARSLCADRTEVSDAELDEIAVFAAKAQRQRLAEAIDRLLSEADAEPAHVVLSGSGTFLAERAVVAHPSLADLPRTRLRDLFDAEAASAACALAAAVLASERGGSFLA